MIGRSARARPSVGIGHVALLLPWITAVVGARLPIRDNSFLWHVTSGRLQIDLGSVLTEDPFSFTFGGKPWRTQSWLIELAYGWFEDLTFVTPFVLFMAIVTYGGIALVAFAHTRSVMATALTGVMAAWLSAAFLSPRPVIVSYALFALVIVACTHRRLRWTLALLGWIWSSVHGSFVLGIGYVVLDGLRRRDRGRILDASVMAIAATMTAHGIGTWGVLSRFVLNSGALDLIAEWATPDFTALALVPFLVTLLLLMTGGIRGRLQGADMVVLAPFVVFAMTSTRAVFPAWLAVAPFVASTVVGVPESVNSDRRNVRLLAGIAVSLVAFPLVLPVEDGSRLSPDFPQAAAALLTADQVFHDDYVGGYLIYRFGVERPVFVDDRAELYGEAHLRSMVQARNGMPSWNATFSEWGVTQALVRRTDSLAVALERQGWVVVYSDGDWVVFEQTR